MFPSLYGGVTNSDLDLYSQYPHCQYRMLTVNGEPSQVTFRKTFDIGKFLNTNKDPLSNIATTSSNPTKGVYLIVYTQCTDLSTSAEM
jgi:hypothetical protein